MGVVRDARSLGEGMVRLEALGAEGVSAAHLRRRALARAALACALAREETRGAQVRRDFPATSEAFQATALVLLDEVGEPEIRFASVGEVVA